MKISLLSLHKTTGDHYPSLLRTYIKRIKKYIDFSYTEIAISTSGKQSEDSVRQKETTALLKHLLPGDYIVLLDEKGTRLTSNGMAEFIHQKQIENRKNLVFIIGGPYGFSNEIRTISASSIRISDMTFTHQMVRLFFSEQLYRAFTILQNEPYHHT